MLCCQLRRAFAAMPLGNTPNFAFELYRSFVEKNIREAMCSNGAANLEFIEVSTV